jgi:hypothetical protein
VGKFIDFLLLTVLVIGGHDLKCVRNVYYYELLILIGWLMGQPRKETYMLKSGMEKGQAERM